jgi:hypothetical protein
MRSCWARSIVITAIACFAGLIIASSAFGAGKQTLTGEVGDAMCGREHMQGTPADCTRACVGKGSKYALVVGDKIYVLETSDKAVLALLNQQAGKKATVTGTMSGTSIEVSTAVAAK